MQNNRKNSLVNIILNKIMLSISDMDDFIKFIYLETYSNNSSRNKRIFNMYIEQIRRLLYNRRKFFLFSKN